MKIKINEQKNNKIKKVFKQSKMIWKVYESTIDHFVLASYSWERNLPWDMINISSDTPLEKTDLPFACRYQLQVASWSGVEAHVHFPVPGRDLHCTCTGLMCTASICEFICAEVMWCLEDTISLVSSSSGSYNLSDSVYTHRSLSLIGRRKISCLGLTECSSISGSLHTVHTWVSVLVPI